jgi:hypothetical protein
MVELSGMALLSPLLSMLVGTGWIFVKADTENGYLVLYFARLTDLARRDSLRYVKIETNVIVDSTT